MVADSLFSMDKIGARSSMDPQRTVSGPHWRIGIITDRLIRFEWSDTDEFVDDATQIVLNRSFGDTPKFRVTRRDGRVLIDTDAVRITYDEKPFSRFGLSAFIKGVGSTWRFSEPARANLGGTARTLDQIDGPVELDEGLAAFDGWAVIDDSQSNLIREVSEVDGHDNAFGTWVQPRNPDEPSGATPSSHDFYLFAYGHDFADAVRDFYQLTGPTPLLPRFTLGNWWSRYHAYSDEEYRELITRFEDERVPLSVAVIDMDWHLVHDIDPKYGTGWTGFTWNRDLFPQPEQFLDWLHQRGLRTTLNLHPADGIRAFEEAYQRVATRMGIDPASEDPAEFDLTDPRFMQIYFEEVIHPMEKEGVDFWWLDWQQGGTTRQPGLDPLWMINHLHFLDSAQAGERPLTFSRYAGPGSHRYPVGFSGDTVVSWDSLKFQPFFTSTASNIGYSWWSHDIGGHMFGVRDEELEARWYQLGTFSPINRLHSTESAFNSKEPWNFHDETRSVMNQALRLRHQLIPYLYTMNRHTAYEGRPLVEPMYWQAPETADACDHPHEFRFGSQLLVAAITDPREHDTMKAQADVWFPRGTWFDFFTGRRVESRGEAGRRLRVWRDLDSYPVFAPAGAIIPLQDNAPDQLNNVDNPEHLRVIVMPGDNGEFVLWEDDGAAQENVAWAATTLSLNWSPADDSDTRTFTIYPPADHVDVLPATRTWTLVFRGVAPIDEGDVTITVNNAKVASERVALTYCNKTLSYEVTIADVPADQQVTVEMSAEALTVADDPWFDDAFDLLFKAQIGYPAKERAIEMIREEGERALGGLASLGEPTPTIQWPHKPEYLVVPDSVRSALDEILTRTSRPHVVPACPPASSSR